VFYSIDKSQSLISDFQTGWQPIAVMASPGRYGIPPHPAGAEDGVFRLIFDKKRTGRSGPRWFLLFSEITAKQINLAYCARDNGRNNTFLLKIFFSSLCSLNFLKPTTVPHPCQPGKGCGMPLLPLGFPAKKLRR
ncbi:MAG: hypothetical protein Q4A04_05000, partial [Eubacteriales bacterium]|nr:hypothetical protein [Eubacteriales bacterium]